MIVGHEKQIQLLKSLFNSKKLSHTFLFCGNEKLGKKKVAIEFASFILNASPFSHPDFFYLEPQNNKIKIEEIRNLIGFISLTSSVAKFKVAIIDRADRMTLDAQHCLLKTLEEPKGKAVIILIAESEHFLLETIISRCQKIKFFPVPKEKIEIFLKEREKDEKKVKRVLRFVNGKPGLAIELLEHPQKLEQFEKLEEFLLKIKNTSIYLKFQKTKELLDNLDIFEILEVVALFFRERIFYKESREILDFIQKVYFFAKTSHLDKRLALETIFLKI